MSIKQSDTSFPQGVNQRRSWPAHTRDWKQEVFDVFKNCTGEVTSTDEELTFLDDTIQPFSWMRILTATLTDNSYIVTTGSNITELLNGYRFCLQCDTANAASPTVTIDGLTAVDLVDNTQTALEADAIAANAIFEIIYETTNNRFQLLKI